MTTEPKRVTLPLDQPSRSRRRGASPAERIALLFRHREASWRRCSGNGEAGVRADGVGHVVAAQWPDVVPVLVRGHQTNCGGGVR